MTPLIGLGLCIVLAFFVRFSDADSRRASSNSSQLYSITCVDQHDPAYSFLARLAKPVYHAVVDFWHSSCHLYPDGETFTELKMTSWPQYANETGAKIEGFAYAVPQCAMERRERTLVLCRLLHLASGDLDPIMWASMPVEYLSWGVAAATLSLQRGTESRTLDGWTNENGHFSSFVRVEGDDTASNQNKTLLPVDAPDPSSNQSAHHVRVEKLQIVIQDCKLSPLPRTPTDLDVFHVPPKGLTIVSDVDDVLRVAEVWNVKQALLDFFVRDFVPWGVMPEIYRAWQRAAPEAHFHYATDTPEMSSRFQVDGIAEYYPPGTFDFRPMQHYNLSDFLGPRSLNIKQLIESFPSRQFVLVGDTSVPSTVSTYVALAKQFPDAVQCIIMRDTSATERANWLVAPMTGLAKLKGRFILFGRSEELRGTEDLMKQLAGGQAVGCGSFATKEIEGRVYGAVTSVLASAWRGTTQVLQCAFTKTCRWNAMYFRPGVAVSYQKQEPGDKYLSESCKELARDPHEVKSGHGDGFIGAAVPA